MVYKILIKKYVLKRIVHKKMKKPNYYIPRIYAKFFQYFFVNLVFIIYISYFSVIDLRFRATAQIFSIIFSLYFYIYFSFFSPTFSLYSRLIKHFSCLYFGLICPSKESIFIFFFKYSFL